MRVPATPPDIKPLLPRYLEAGEHRRVVRAAGGATPGGRYLHWDQLRYRELPAGLSREEWWLGIKLARSPLYRYFPLRSRDGEEFVIALLPTVEFALDRIDDETRGVAAVGRRGLGEADRAEALMEEAIHSAQMDGAAMGVEQAKALLYSGRAPQTRSERIVFDTWDGLQLVREVSDEPLTPELFNELHRAITARTLDRGQAGRLRQSHEDPHVYTLRGEELFAPPVADELPERLADLCAFANGESPDWAVHPVLRAILAHLWVGYEHPFVDGNGRFARALFLWAMLSQGYPIFEHLPLSRIMRRDKSAYERAYLYTTTDGFDATYFVLLMVETIAEALDALDGNEEQVESVPVRVVPQAEEEPTELALLPAGMTIAPLSEKHPNATLIERAMRAGGTLNQRQLALVERALRRPEEIVTIKTHQERHQVAYETARLDLQDLYARGLLMRFRVGRSWEFQTVQDVAERLFKSVRH